MSNGVQERLSEDVKKRGLKDILTSTFRIEGKDNPWTQIVHSPAKYGLGLATAGLAVGFPRYFDHWVYFVGNIDVWDSVIMGVTSFFLLYNVVRDVQKRVEDTGENATLRRHLQRVARNPSQAKIDAFVEEGKNNRLMLALSHLRRKQATTIEA